MSPIDEYVSSSKKYDWMTPDEWFNFLDDIFGFTLDVSALKWNAKCEDYFTPEDNALTKSWKTSGRWWDNPPWGKQYKEDTGLTIEDWINKTLEEFEEGNEGVMLVPENPTTGWYHRNVKKVPYVFEPEGRFRYVDPKSNKPSQPTKGTLVWIFVDQLTKEQATKLNMRGRISETLIPKSLPRERMLKVLSGFKGAGIP